jgi:hypothetical protein
VLAAARGHRDAHLFLAAIYLGRRRRKRRRRKRRRRRRRRKRRRRGR